MTSYLEDELGAALRERNDYRKLYETACADYARVQGERDEARADVERLRIAAAQAEEMESNARRQFTEIEGQRDAAREDRDRFERERNEARAEVEHLRTVGARADGERMQEVLRLRAEVERLKAGPQAMLDLVLGREQAALALLSECRELLEAEADLDKCKAGPSCLCCNAIRGNLKGLRKALLEKLPKGEA